MSKTFQCVPAIRITQILHFDIGVTVLYKVSGAMTNGNRIILVVF